MEIERHPAMTAVRGKLQLVFHKSTIDRELRTTAWWHPPGVVLVNYSWMMF
jgi:hypothetical protein